MITKVIMPQMSLTMQAGIVSKWFKIEGDSVNAGDVICTIEGDKAALDIEAPVSGYLKKIVAKEGEEFPVKHVMAYIGGPGDVVADVIEELRDVQDTDGSNTRIVKSEENTNVDRVKASPIAKRLAKEKGIDLSKITGSGPDGLIGKEDVLSNKVPDQSPHSERGFQELNSVEKVIADRMAMSNKEIPHFHLSLTLDITATNKIRKDSNKSNKQHITLTDLFVYAVEKALKNNTKLNSTFMDKGFLTHDQINIGLAVDTPKGLMVPVIKNVDGMKISEISKAREILVEKAGKGNLSPDDLSEGTFTITNLGMYNIESFDPIVVPGQVGILGVGAIQNGDKGIEKINITLGCDHRVVDGVAGAKFLSSIKDLLEKPEEIF